MEDVKISDDVEKIVKTTLDKFGKIDILVNNVGTLCTFTALNRVTGKSNVE